MILLAPEIIALLKKCQQDENFDQVHNPFKPDVYSLGISVLRMINYKYGKISLKKNKDFLSTLVGYEKLIPILNLMLKANPDVRLDFISFDDIFKKEHNFLLK